MESSNSTTRETTTSVRLTTKERQEMESLATNLGFRSISDYIRHLHKERQKAYEPPREFEWTQDNLIETIKTDLGSAYTGNALDFLYKKQNEGTVDLIMTSPPFGLVRKKTYGNEDAHEYCDWFRPFAEGFSRVLKDTGSLVIDIGGAWKPGIPTRSLYHFELVMMLTEEFGFHLCQEHYWWNPSKLPTPAEWVNIRRIRVKDAVNTVWWLSKTPWPKANNRRVLAPYSESMKSLMKNGYKAKTRPSGHVISEKFGKDNGGSVPPNLMAIANTESNSAYQEYCRNNGLAIHPARFPSLLPEYFIKYLTDPGDLVFDPFAGSCVAGAVSERLGRHWVCTELNSEYLEGAKVRFNGELKSNGHSKQTMYQISTPCAVPVDESEVPLREDGGRTR